MSKPTTTFASRRANRKRNKRRRVAKNNKKYQPKHRMAVM